MSQEDQIRKMKEHQRKVLYSTLMASGAGMILVGVFGLLSPEVYFALLNTGPTADLSMESIRQFSMLLTLIGLADIVIASIVFKDRKTL